MTELLRLQGLGSPERIHRLWLEKRCEEQPEDLSGKLPVMLGCWTEAFNRQWFERVTGRTGGRMGSLLDPRLAGLPA